MVNIDIRSNTAEYTCKPMPNECNDYKPGNERLIWEEIPTKKYVGGKEININYVREICVMYDYSGMQNLASYRLPPLATPWSDLGYVGLLL